MKYLFFISGFFISVFTFGQSSSTSTQIANVEIISVDTISWENLKMGFVKNNSDCHCSYRLDSNSTFKLFSSDCSTQFVIDTGVWEIKNNNSLVLKSKEDTKVFQLIKVSGCTFFIPPNELHVFTKDLKTVLAKSKSTAPSKYFTWSLMFKLGNKYFCW